MKEMDLSDLELDWDLAKLSHNSTIMSPFKSGSDEMQAPLSIQFEEISLASLWDQPEVISLAPLLRSPISLQADCSNATERSRNGLKNLTLKIRDIVLLLETCTYNNVADKLLAEMKIQINSKPTKNEKNVRRRVYDSLNVLLAAGMLRKHGKNLTLAPTFKEQNRKVKSSKLTDKRKKLKSLMTEYSALNNLFKRNTNLGKTSEVLPFPITVVALKEHGSYEMYIKGKKTTMKLKGPLEIISPQRVLTRMNLDTDQSEIPSDAIEICRYP